MWSPSGWGNFLTLIALCPLQGGGNQELRQDPVQSPLPCPGTPPPQGMADDRCIKKFTRSFKFLPNSLLYFIKSDISMCVENIEVSKSSIQCGYTPSIHVGGKVSVAPCSAVRSFSNPPASTCLHTERYLSSSPSCFLAHFIPRHPPYYINSSCKASWYAMIALGSCKI